jgi:hypothetical protein
VKELDEEDLLETKGACVITAGLQSLDILVELMSPKGNGGFKEPKLLCSR